MTTPFTTYPAPRQSSLPTPDPADLWDYLVYRGLSKADATRHVMLVLQNQPAEVQRQYLKDVDPGKLASFGLGAADMMSFGLGDQLARKLEGQEAIDTQQAAKQQHPTAHLLGEIAGALTPIGVDLALERAGVMAPSALRTLASGVKSTAGRAAAKTAVNAVEGALYAGAQAGGRAESGRLRAAVQAAPLGAAAGIALPWLAGTAGAAAKKILGPVMERVAGKAPVASSVDEIAQIAAENQAMNKRAAQWIAERQGMGLPPSTPTPPPLTPIPGSPNGFLGPEGISPAPKASYPPTLAEMQGFRVEPLPKSPLEQTAAEATTTAGGKALQAQARAAARAAFKKAAIAARWAAAHVGLLAQ